VLADLDTTFTALDGPLSTSLADDIHSINSIHDNSSMGLPGYLSGFALAFNVINCIGVFALTIFLSSQLCKSSGPPHSRRTLQT